MSQSPKTRRRVLVQMLSSRQRVEMVELLTEVRMTGGFGTEGFEAELGLVEAQARQLMTIRGIDQADFSLVGVLCAMTLGHHAGRIVWVRQAETKQGELAW